MSERKKPHHGRDVDGRFKVRQADVDELLEVPEGVDYLRDDVRLGGAVADTGASAAQRAAHIRDLVDENRLEVDRMIHPERSEPGPENKPANKRSRRKR